MAKYRVWTGENPESDDVEILKSTSSLKDVMKYIRKNTDLDESNSGLHMLDGTWDEWLDEDDQNIHEHLYMYGGKSKYLRIDDDEDDDFDEEEDIEEDEEEPDEEDAVEEDLDDRLMDVIGGGRSKTQAAADEEVIEDDDDDFDDDEDDDSFDDEEDEDA